jgi:Phage XkdN-like protein.
MSELLDRLLRADLPDVRKKLPEKKITVNRLTKELKADAVFTLRGISYNKVQEIQAMDRKEIEIQEILEGCVDPNFRDPKMLSPEKGIATPADAVTALLNPGEIKAIAFEIDRLTGYRQETIREVKNA